jgi:hypothetical protein
MFEKGQTVYLEMRKSNPVDRTGDIIEGVVTAVGRTYYTVKTGWRELKFYKDTLMEHTDFGAECYLFPSEETVYDDRKRCKLLSQLRAGLERYDCDLSLGQLRRIKDIMEEGVPHDNQRNRD